jgi:hypothetical protein
MGVLSYDVGSGGNVISPPSAKWAVFPPTAVDGVAHYLGDAPFNACLVTVILINKSDRIKTPSPATAVF